METWSWSWLRLGVTGFRSAIFLLCWIIANVALFTYGFIEQRDDNTLARLNKPIGNSVYVSRGAGLVLVMHACLIVLPVCRNILASLQNIRFLRNWISFQKNIHFHKIVAWTMLVFTVIHVSAHLFNFRMVEERSLLGPDQSALRILWTHPAGLTGVVMLAIMLLMYTSALLPIRQQSFELFWYIHHLSIPFLVILCLHPIGCFVRRADGTCKPYNTWAWSLAGICIYISERILREFRSRKLTYITKVVQHSNNVVEIQFRKTNFTALPGQYVFICIPEIASLEWHPFTLTSAPQDEFLSVHIRIVGDWTKAVAKRLGYCEDSQKLNPSELPLIRIDGPFGTPSQEFVDYDTVVMVGGGIGVTPFASILKSIWYQRHHQWKTSSPPLKLKKVHFFWICRDTQAFEWFDSVLSALEKDLQGDSNDFLHLHIHLTRSLNVEHLNNVCLFANATKDPITKLKSRTYFGRPNFDGFFQQLRKDSSPNADEHRKVGVFVCGPLPLKRSVRSACQKASTANFSLRFHAEKF